MAKQNKRGELFEVNLKETDARTFILFIQTADAVLKYADAVLNKAGLSLIKLMVLQVLQAHGGTLTPSGIARLILREKHTTTTLIRRLQQDELVKVEGNTVDRRSIHVTITEKGKKTVNAVAPVARNIVKQAMSSIPDSSAAVLEESLKTLRRNAVSGLAKVNERK